jgi:hypothetical protein
MSGASKPLDRWLRREAAMADQSFAIFAAIRRAFIFGE